MDGKHIRKTTKYWIPDRSCCRCCCYGAAAFQRHVFPLAEGSVLHCQTTLPPANDGVSTMLRVVPIEESLPLIVIVPVSVTEPPEIRPAVVTVKPVPAPSKDPLTVATSTMSRSQLKV